MITACVVRNMIAVDTAFSSATLITFTGSMIPSFIRSIAFPVSIENPFLNGSSSSMFSIAFAQSNPALSMICFVGYLVASLNILLASLSSLLTPPSHIDHALSRASPHPIVNHS